MFDTDVVSCLIKYSNRPKQLVKLVPSRVCVSAITKAELLFGLKKLASGHFLHRKVQDFFGKVRVLAWDAKAAEYYADIRYQLLREGKPIGELDMLIAAHALALDAILVTNNVRHYSRIDLPIRLENWK